MHKILVEQIEVRLWDLCSTKNIVSHSNLMISTNYTNSKKNEKKNCLIIINLTMYFLNQAIGQFWYIKIQPKAIDLSAKLWGINPRTL